MPSSQTTHRLRTTNLSGAADWGIHQVPGALEAMEERAAHWAGTWLTDGAGHWVQQERPGAVSARLAAFASRGREGGAGHGEDPDSPLVWAANV